MNTAAEKVDRWNQQLAHRCVDEQLGKEFTYLGRPTTLGTRQTLMWTHEPSSSTGFSSWNNLSSPDIHYQQMPLKIARCAEEEEALQYDRSAKLTKNGMHRYIPSSDSTLFHTVVPRSSTTGPDNHPYLQNTYDVRTTRQAPPSAQNASTSMGFWQNTRAKCT
jgi:hypothetical protein